MRTRFWTGAAGTAAGAAGAVSTVHAVRCDTGLGRRALLVHKPQLREVPADLEVLAVVAAPRAAAPFSAVGS